MRMRVYISGPIEGTSDHQERFEAAGRLLESHGYIPVNPEPLGRILPGGTHTEYMLICLKLLELSDSIYMLAGWQKSRGAKMEYEQAQRLKLPILEGGYDESTDSREG